MAGYVRNDVTDQIANGNTVDAIPLDGEFDALQAAFVSTTGHSHNGSLGEGGPILVAGPAQDVVVSANSITPKTDNFMDLGAPTFEWKNLYVDGVANIDSLVADTADINAGTIDATTIGATTPAAITGTAIIGTSLAGPLTGNVTGSVTGNVTGNVIGNVTGNTSTATTLQTARNISLSGDVSGTVSFDGSANSNIVATVADNSHNHLATNITDFATAVSSNTAVAANTAKITNATHTGDVTGSTALTITNNAVTNAKAADVPTSTIKGRVTAATGDPEDLTPAQVSTLLNLGTAATTAATDYATAAQGALADSAVQPTDIATQSVWNTGTSTTEALISPLKLRGATAPKPTSASGVGQWAGISEAATYTLPTGGTWAWCYLSFNSGNELYASTSGISAGGSTLFNDGGTNTARGFAWRIT